MSKYKTKVKELPNSEVEIEVELPSEVLDKSRTKAIERLGNHLEIAGFRKGKIPENVILQNVGEARLLEEAADIAVNEHYPELLKELSLETIGRPLLSVVKLAFGNPLLFKIKTAVLPEFKLPDYKKIASDIQKKDTSKDDVVEASEKEIDDVVLQIRKNKAHGDWHKVNPGKDDHSEHPDFDKEENLPIVDDSFAKIVGNFDTVSALREKIKENIIEDKKLKNIEKRRASVIEEILKQTEMELPEILIESEIEKSLAQIKDDIARIGGKFEDYLEHMKKKEEDLRKDLRGEATNKAKIQLIFNKIAEVEKIEPNREILEAEVKKILEYYPEAKEENARIYIATALQNQEVLKLLESTK